MNNSPSIIHRSLERERKKMLPGVVLSFTTLAHPPERFGPHSRIIGLIELEDGGRVLAPLLGTGAFIGQRVYPRMSLSHVTPEQLRVYEVAFEARAHVAAPTSNARRYILALSGPSGVGKSTISTLFARASAEYAERVPILTTREARAEDEGEYVYVSKKEFDSLKLSGAIVASTDIPSSSENRTYGYRGEDIERIWKKGKVPVVVTEMNLLAGLAAYYGRPTILSFGLLPPGRNKRAMVSQLLHRLRSRGREKEEHIKDRLKNAERDLAFFNDRKDLFDHMVVNEDLSTTITSIQRKMSSVLQT